MSVAQSFLFFLNSSSQLLLLRFGDSQSPLQILYTCTVLLSLSLTRQLLVFSPSDY